MPPGDRTLRHSSHDGPLKLSKMCSERSELYGRVSSPNATFSIPFGSYLKALSNTKDSIKLWLNPSEIWCQNTSVPPQRAIALQSMIHNILLYKDIVKKQFHLWTNKSFFYWFYLIAVTCRPMGHCITEPTTWPDHFSCHRAVVHMLFL